MSLINTICSNKIRTISNNNNSDNEIDKNLAKSSIDKKILNFIYSNFDFFGTNSEKENFSEKLAEIDVFFLTAADHAQSYYEKINVLIEHFIAPQSQISTESTEIHSVFSKEWMNQVNVWEPLTVREKKRKHFETYDATHVLVRMMRDSLALIFQTSSLITQFDATLNWKADPEECIAKLRTNLELFRSQLGKQTPKFVDEIYQQLSDCKQADDFPKGMLKSFFIHCFEDFLMPFVKELNELLINATAVRDEALFKCAIESVRTGRPNFFFGGLEHFVPAQKMDKEILTPLYQQLNEKQIRYMILGTARCPKPDPIDYEQIEKWKEKSIAEVELEDNFPVYNIPLETISNDELESLGVSHLNLKELSEDQQNDLFKLKLLRYFWDDVLEISQISASARLYDFIDLVLQLDKVSELLRDEDFLEAGGSDNENESSADS